MSKLLTEETIARKLHRAYKPGTIASTDGYAAMYEKVELTCAAVLVPLVCREDEEMEKVVVSGVTYNKNEAKIAVVRVPDRPGIAAKLFRPLTEDGINVDMIVQNISHGSGKPATDISFTVDKPDLLKARKGYFRSWDHQLIQEAYPFTVKPKGQAKDKWDFLAFGAAVMQGQAGAAAVQAAGDGDAGQQPAGYRLPLPERA